MFSLILGTSLVAFVVLHFVQFKCYWECHEVFFPTVGKLSTSQTSVFFFLSTFETYDGVTSCA